MTIPFRALCRFIACDRLAELLVCGIRQGGMVGLGEALREALGGTVVEVHAIDQPWPVVGLHAEKRRRGDVFGALGGDPHDRVRLRWL